MNKIDFFEFRTANKLWRFTSQNKITTMSYSIDKYYPCVIGRSNIEDSDIDKTEVEIYLPYPYQLINEQGDNLQDYLINKIYLENISVIIREYISPRNQSLVIFKGRVTQPKFNENEHTLTLICSTAETFLNRNILTRQVQRTCANKVYDRFCGLNMQNFAMQITITNIINHQTIEYMTENQEIKPIGFFSRGLLLKDGEYSFISNDDGRLYLYRENKNLNIGDVVTIYAGCDNSLKTCHEKFKNSLNFCGFPNIPNKVPTTIL